jgi:hypothetical protein
MTERLLQYIWQFHLFNKKELRSTAGEDLEIISQGHYNIHQGPDFTEGRVRIGKNVWAGNIELHVNASDWRRHSHCSDAHYNNVILHVVWHDDENNENRSRFPTLILQDRVAKLLLNNFDSLMRNQSFIPCETSIMHVDELIWISWKERLLVERLQRKSSQIRQMLAKNSFHWEETLWWMLARAFGLHVNSDAFYEMAKSIPYNVLLKHSRQIHHAEALIFGQCGMLETSFREKYPIMLAKEYAFLRTKYNLAGITVRLKFLRMRPACFPTVRLAQLAMVIHLTENMWSSMINASSVSAARELINVTANDYWHYHFRFDEETAYKPKKTGTEIINSVVLNTFIPVMYAYGYHHSETLYQQKAIDWAMQLRGENNSIVNHFQRIGVAVKNSADSQAVIELKSQYCDKRMCLDCAIGNAVLKRSIFT